MTLTYQQYEKAVFDWLMAKNEIDRNFTFSTRLKATKGSELDYFIGTEKSGYFGFTFWEIPVSFPGSSADLIDFFFERKDGGFKYFVEFGHTLTPEGKQNESALALIKQIKNRTSQVESIISESKGDRSFNFKIGAPQQIYPSLNELFIDLDKTINTLIPIVDECILEEKTHNLHFKADRIPALKFAVNQIEMQGRIEKYSRINFQTLIDEEVFNPTSEFVLKKNILNHTPLNQILYGPPGTGKTFSTIDVVVDILEPNNNYTRIQKKAKFDMLVNENRAFFNTFHQSMSYEEFIEGIKPKTVKDQVQYEITNGILKDICDLCFEDIKEMKALSISESFELSFKEKFQEFGKAIQQGIIELKTRSGITVQISKISSAGNLQLNSGEDTRDYVISMKRLEKLAKAFPNPSVIKNIHEEIRAVIGGSNSSLYFAALEAFVSFEKKITETVKKDGKEISLSEIQLSEEEIAALPPYFLIIDEINRGNVSAIFGELITLIEEDKRFGKTNQLFVKLPYSREEFILPPNLYIIGTMNTADRSVEALDTALRRRFSFVEMLPDASKLENKQVEGIDLSLLLNTLNERIEVLVDRDHTIGHAFFMNIESLSDLRSAFANKIVPLLQEYFYGNYRKMEMVIGSAFFNITEANKVKFAVKSDEFDADGTVYHIKNISHSDGMSDTVFIEALNQLIKGA